MIALARRLHLDAAVAITIVQRLWGVVAGIVMVVVTSTLFTGTMQGYYYTFSSLIALQAFFELGLNFVLTQFVSHDAIHLSDTSTPQERQVAIDRIGLLYRSVRRWFGVIAVLFAVSVGCGGIVILEKGGSEVHPAEWVTAWLLIVITAAVNLYYSPQIAIAEGIGKVAQVARLRIVQSLGGYGLCWAFILIVHPTLVAVAAIGTVQALTSGIWMLRRSELPEIACQASSQGVSYSWRREIFPLQWRMALSWMSGYLLYQVFTPLIFAHRGALEAGRIGLSMAMFSNISLIAMSWMSASSPALAGMTARGDFEGLRRKFISLFLQSMAFQCLACVGLGAVVMIGLKIELRIMERFLPLADLSILAIIAICNVAIYGLAMLTRVQKKEPMLWNSLVSGALVAATTFFTSFHGAHFVVVGYLVIIAGISLPWTVAIFRRYWLMTISDRPSEGRIPHA